MASVAVVFATACGGGAADAPSGTLTTFKRLQSGVLEPSCASSSCHSTATAAGGLALTGGDVYAALVNAVPTVQGARDAGLKRVMPGDPARSLLWHKLDWAAGHHGADYGDAMPLHGPPLSVEQVEFVKRWIAGGAKSSGDDVDPSLLNGTTAQATAQYVPLTIPAQGIQLKVAPFTVPPRSEREIFVYTPLNNASDIYVTRIEMQMRTGSHHLLAYTMAPGAPFVPAPNEVRDLHAADGSLNVLTALAMPYHVFFAGSMTPTMSYDLPAGVALKVPAGQFMDLNAHYVNSSATPITGEAEMNFHTVPLAQVQKAASTLFMSNSDITIPAGRDTTITRTFKVTVPTTVFTLSSHMHKRGVRFRIRIAGGARAGELVYENTDWEHPSIKSFDVPILLKAGEGLMSEVTYHGDATKVVRFGLTSDDEMGIIFGYWY